MSTVEADARKDILNRVVAFHETAFPQQPFIPGTTPVPVSGRVFDGSDMAHLVDSALDFWLTTGRFADQFERELAAFVGVDHAILCNSGSSANLLAIAALTSPRLADRRLRPGDEVITVAAGFPTTLNPLLQHDLLPVFVDVDLDTLNPSLERVAAALTPRTRAIILAHTLGTPFDAQAFRELADQHGLWLIEDNCDALGSRLGESLTGTFGHLATASFYPAHHITMGEGGAVLTSDGQLRTLVESFRDWGRDCYCPPGHDNTCKQRFDQQHGTLPHGYDHKYVYSHIGYNLKATDMQAAIGVAQLAKLPEFIRTRRQNYDHLAGALAPACQTFRFCRPLPTAEPAWFGFPLTLSDQAPFSREELLRHLNRRRIGTRLLFGGNLTRQPAYRDAPHRVAEPLVNTDTIMAQTFWVGTYPGLTPPMLDYLAASILDFCQDRKTSS